MRSKKITKLIKSNGFKDPIEATLVRGKFFNDLKFDWDAHIPSDGSAKFDTVAEYTSATGVTVDGVLLKDSGISTTSNVTEYTKLVTLTATEIVGNAAGDLNHADGAVLVASAGAGYVHQFVSAVLIYDYDTAAYGGGGDDTVINVGVTGTQVAHTVAIASADLLGAGANKIVQVSEISASDQALTITGADIISLYSGTIWTLGTAAGVLRIYVTYRVITTGL